MVKKADSTRNDIIVECDPDTMDYYSVWEPVVVGAGKTEREALDDLRAAAHFSVDKLIELRIKNK
ncbi:MAG: hypothetical protein JW845_09250 [Dehalococcoidales bacterium]|nr:hypothetical protein [Dehalococcoidales bacterium]